MKILHVAPPRVGSALPSEVRAELKFSLSPGVARSGGGGGSSDIRSEWDELREHDIVFLIAVSPPTTTIAETSSFRERFGVISVRGASVLALKDGEGNYLSDPNPHTKPRQVCFVG
jgi:intron-binding protein aquarius